MVRNDEDSHVGRAKNRVLAIRDDRLRRTYAKALRESMMLDLNNLARPRVASPRELLDKYGINLDQQRHYGISLTKRDSLRYLSKDCGMMGLKQGRINREITRDRYKRRFGKNPSTLNNKTLLFSCAEIQHLVKHEFQLARPFENDESWNE